MKKIMFAAVAVAAMAFAACNSNQQPAETCGDENCACETCSAECTCGVVEEEEVAEEAACQCEQQCEDCQNGAACEGKCEHNCGDCPKAECEGECEHKCEGCPKAAEE